MKKTLVYCSIWAVASALAYCQDKPALFTDTEGKGKIALAAIQDTFVRKEFPDRNYGKSKALSVDGGDKKVGDKSHCIAFLKFPLEGAGRPIMAKLRMKMSAKGHAQSRDAGRIHLVKGTWDEETVTYGSQPELGREIGRTGKVEKGETLTRDLDVDLAGLKEISLALVPTTTDGATFLSREGGAAPELVAFYGDYAVVQNGPLKLSFMAGSGRLVTIEREGTRAGGLGFVVAQFEKKGIGYKGAGVGIAEATAVKSVDVKVNEPKRCVVHVTVERTESVEMGRRFEATHEFSLYAGQKWFEAKLLSVKNTDGMAYQLRGYGYLLQPETMSECRPWCYPMESTAAWIREGSLLGATARPGSDFTLGLRLAEGTPHGEITRTARAEVSPGMTWSASEAGVIVFADEGREPEGMVRESRNIKDVIRSPDQHAIGSIVLKEQKWGAAGPEK